LLVRALAHRLRQLADLLGQPSHRGRHTAFAVARLLARVKNTTGALASLANVIGQNGGNPQAGKVNVLKL
jgi:hypothetical protein